MLLPICWFAVVRKRLCSGAYLYVTINISLISTSYLTLIILLIALSLCLPYLLPPESSVVGDAALEIVHRMLVVDKVLGRYRAWDHRESH
ncbi:hypothetical protein GQ43DRAFT_275927 [Delitschia confertaspora ATCC 74209]|uniref:Uncharacterized protein n=1 Tax=Delitschia confertaspora ATCC 74209 TaxID=1513339 RepID=A0A9P4MMN3_9PLEO|nr:hypothetical protein GQ43DRAFT_275927 [Delitschia confertaspora ATCC 74209]